MASLRRIAIVLGAVLIASFSMASPATTQPVAPDFTMSVTSNRGPIGSTRRVVVLFDHGSRIAVHGWSVSVCHEGVLVSIADAESGEATQIVDDDLIGPPGGVAVIEPSDDSGSGSGLVMTLIVCASAVAPRPALETRPIAIESPFSRGDCNQDTSIDISEVVAILDSLFIFVALIACEGACDVNENGTPSVADRILLLSVLFGGSGAIPDLVTDLSCGSLPVMSSAPIHASGPRS